MCLVRTRHFNCNHFFHEVVKTYPNFDKILDNAHIKPALLNAHQCGKLGEKFDECKQGNATATATTTTTKDDLPPSMIDIRKLEGPWREARRNIVGGHCVKPKFLPGNDPGGPSKYPHLTMYCKKCQEVVEARRLEQKQKQGFLRWFRS